MKCCEFDNEEFPTEIQKLENEQLPTIKHEPKAIFYKRCWL